jgi:hypothetical protein
MSQIDSDHFTNALIGLLDETMDHVMGFYLDSGTSLFETLNTISAEEASVPVGGKCATLAAQVKHMAFYLDMVEKSIRDPSTTQVDWGQVWREVSAVTPQEWRAIQAELRSSYIRILVMIKDVPAWPSEAEIGGAMAILAHTAYHLGEIRQALCTLKK